MTKRGEQVVLPAQIVHAAPPTQKPNPSDASNPDRSPRGSPELDSHSVDFGIYDGPGGT